MPTPTQNTSKHSPADLERRREAVVLDRERVQRDMYALDPFEALQVLLHVLPSCQQLYQGGGCLPVRGSREVGGSHHRCEGQSVGTERSKLIANVALVWGLPRCLPLWSAGD